MKIPLKELQILALDCQATGANPQKGHLLEIGWIKTRAAAGVSSGALLVKSYLAGLPRGAEIPPAVQRVTGISKDALHKALAPADIWQEVIVTANEIAADNRMDTCPTIIHYARFEEPFLRDLNAKNNCQRIFPLRIICTHEIAKRLLPGLPRKGLRAVAGYFGHSVPPSRRSADHAVATAVIWQNLILQLKAEQDIQHLDQLMDWLNRTTGQSRTGRVYPLKPEIRLSLPQKPGVYRMRRSNKDLLYIGKATSLKQRVNSYFRQKGTQAEHTLEMLSQAADLDVTLTGSALEAAVLESDEIKRYAPPYNVALQKGQRTLEFFSRDLQKRSVEPDNIHGIGPLPEGNLTDAMAAFGIWHAKLQDITQDEVLEIGYAILGVPETYAPEPDCLAGGLDLFRHHHLERLSHSSPLRAVTRLGHKLWRERLAELAKAQTETVKETVQEEPVDQGLEVDEAPSWTPETVARGIEKFTMRSALIMRRARWLCLLSQSSLAWEARGSNGRHKIVLLFENGAVGHRQEMSSGKTIPLSPGYAKCMLSRQKKIDLATYERLRVVTTEMRRLLAEGRKIEIRLRPQAVLNRRQLAKVLPWV
ncbi:MAG: GIY-YIG nuclease family protein [Desulfobacterales bacterium]|jgi:DNA polymerase-3 subunit epsilon